MNFNIFNYHIVRSFLRDLLIKDKFKKITSPDYSKNKYYINNKYAFYLGIDAIIKYEQIIENEDFLEMYINELKKVFTKYKNYNHIKNGIYSTISKIVGMKLKINNIYTIKAREDILHYIYSKYIIDGYFYFGFSSNYLNEIRFVGIRSNTFFIDDKLDYINKLFKKYSGKKLFLNEKTTITDDIVIATYFALISPYYLADIIENPIFKNIKVNKECFYNHDLINIKNSISKVCFNEGLSIENTKEVVDNFTSCYNLSCGREVRPCIAKISRKSLNKNKLKDIDQIINDTDLKLTSAVYLILESRYSSYNIQKNISPSDIEVISLPTYQEFLDVPNNLIQANRIIVDVEKVKSGEYEINNRVKANSYGVISLAYLGLVFILIGSIITLFISFMGG